MSIATLAPPDEDTMTTSLEFALSKFAREHQLLRDYDVRDDDPILEMSRAVERLYEIKAALPAAVGQSIELAGTKLKTEFELVSQPYLQAAATLEAKVDAIVRMLSLSQQQQSIQLEQLEQLEQLTKLGGVKATPNRAVNNWLSIVTFVSTLTTLGVLGWQIQSVRSVGNTLAWVESPQGRLAAQVIAANPNFNQKQNCHQPNRAERNALPKNLKVAKICSFYLH